MIMKDAIGSELRAMLKNRLKSTFNNHGLLLPNKSQRSKSWNSTTESFQSDGFTIQVRDLGDKSKQPCLILAGGPGSPHSDDYKVVLTPRNENRAIIFEPRCVGISQHYNYMAADNDNDKRNAFIESLKLNTLQNQVEDIERARLATASDSKIYVRGNSWGTTVALAYAQTYPQNVSALLLTSPFLATREDTDMILGRNGTSAAEYPDAYEAFVNVVGETAKTAPVDAAEISAKYFDAFKSDDAEYRHKAFKAWLQWEQVRDGANAEITDEIAQNPNKQRRAMVMSFYYANNSFLPEEGVLTKPQLLSNMPIYVVGNSIDPLVSSKTLFTLAEKLPHAEFTDVRRPRHSRVSEDDFNQLHIQEMGAIRNINSKIGLKNVI